MATWVTWWVIKWSRGHPRNWLTPSLGENEWKGHSKGKNMHCRIRGMRQEDKGRDPDCTFGVVSVDNSLEDIVYKGPR